LHEAAKEGRLDALRCLLELRAQLDQVDSEGCTALHRASSRATASALLEARASAHVRDEKRQTPLFHAVVKNDAGIVSILAASGADGDAVDSENRSALFLAAEKASLEVVQSLVREALADPKANVGGQTAQAVAQAAAGQEAVAEYLAEASKASLARASGDESRLRYRLGFEHGESSTQYDSRLADLIRTMPGVFDGSLWPRNN